MPLSEDVVSTIAGPDDGLPVADLANVNGTSAWFPFDDTTGQTVRGNGTHALNLLGTIGFGTGDVTGSGILNTFTLSIGAGKVTLAKMAALAANSLLGNNQVGAATPRALTLSSDFAFVGDTLHLTAAAVSDDAAPWLLHQTLGAF